MLLSIFSIVSIFSIALRRDLSQPWRYGEADVSSVLARWAATGAMSILMDLIITAFSVYLVWSLQMDSKPKSIVITAFALRLFVAPVTIGDGAGTAGGTVVRRNVPPGALAVSSAPQRNLEGWTESKRAGTAQADAARQAREQQETTEG